MIKSVWLFTNRNIAVFDENGEQVVDIQQAIGWNHRCLYEYAERAALEKIVKTEPPPEFYLARWQEWKHKITCDEFCSLIGQGPWYWDYKEEKQKAKEISHVDD